MSFAHREVTCIPCWDPQAPAPLCQRSGVNSNISPSPGLWGHDFEQLIKPSIIHNQITALSTLLQTPQHSFPPPSPLEKPWLNKAEECRGEGKELAGVSGSGRPRLMTRKSTCGSCAPGTKCFHFVAHAWHELTCVPAPRQQCVLLLAGAGLSLAVGELYPAVRVYSLQGRGAEYLSFRWMIK